MSLRLLIREVLKTAVPLQNPGICEPRSCRGDALARHSLFTCSLLRKSLDFFSTTPGIIGYILGLYRDNGKENGNYQIIGYIRDYIVVILGFTFILGLRGLQ